MNQLILKIFFLLFFINLTACKLGPDYQRTQITIPKDYKEAPTDWQIAKPNETIKRGEWWRLFADQTLNQLENKMLAHNQTIKIAEQNYRQASALVDEARAQYFPSLATALIIERGKNANTSNTNTNINTKINTTHTLNLNATWEADIWGAVRRTVEASQASAEGSKAQIELVKLSSAATLAQYYFELRTLDQQQKLLNHTLGAYQKILAIVKNQYRSGVTSQEDILTAENNLETAKTQALDNQIFRSQFEHAIAILVGEIPSNFSLAAQPLQIDIPLIPKQLPATLLQRRPDIAVAERLMAQANANIGVATAAYFPSLNLLASGTSRGIGHWFNKPSLSWALGPTLAEVLIDGGARSAAIRGARATYLATVAQYRQTVLSAFQEVEDSLINLKILSEEARLQNETARRTQLALRLKTNQYQAGTINYAEVLNAQITANTAAKNANNTQALKLLALISLIKSLGGSW